jgi:PAS domain S-box-containing protein
MDAGETLGQRDAVVAEGRLLHALFDRLPAMIAYWDRDCRNVIANNAYIEWFGFSPEQMRGIHIREVLGEAVYAQNLPHIEAALAGEEQLFDRTLVDTVGRTRHTQASYVPDVVDGEVQGFFVLVTDVTPRVEAQRAMDEAQSLARLGSWSADSVTGKVAGSAELYRIFGIDPDQMVPIPDSFLSLVHPDDLEKVAAVRDSAWGNGQEYSIDYRILRPDGAVREVQSRGRPHCDANGKVVRFTGTLQDVTEANEAARELARVNTELVQLNELNADVIGMLGHDVRGPLTVVLGYLEELDEEWDSATETVRKAQVATARAAATRLRTLVDDILALASVESGEIVAEASDHDLTVLVAEAIGEVPGQSEIAIEGDRTLKAWCDAFHVRQIIANLASNALRYGAPPVVVTLAVAGDDTVEVTVADHGPGVPDEFVPNLFDRFSRAPGQTEARGSGLGLYIAGRLAEANHGTLGYERGPDGRGAVFTLGLPRFG